MATKGFNRSPFTKLIFIALILALVLATALIPFRVQAFSVTITVTTPFDNVTADGLCSLREAIINANDNALTYPDCATGPGGAVINFASSMGTATILLTSPLPAISDTSGLTITGGSKITISGNDLYPVFSLNANVPLTLDGLTVAHGLSTSGGGAYVNPGATLTILNSTFSNNKVSNPGNSAAGGGVVNLGTTIITNSTFSTNSAVDSGGGVFSNAGSLTITSSTFSGNSSGYGGGLRSIGAGTISITNSTFSGNSASSYGGGIYHYGSILTITGSTFSSNTAGAGGAINNMANLTVANSTFFGNSASIGGAVYSGYDGFMFGNASIINSTFSANTATTSNGGGGIYNDFNLSLSNTIIANSTAGSGDCVNNGGLNSSTNNLIEDAVNACDLTNGANGNIIGTDPNLGPGTGSPVYLPLNPGSAAINAGDDAKCAAAPVSSTSQNGRARPDGAHCDIGAYEADVTPPTVLSIVRAVPNPSSAASVPFTVTFSEPVYGVTTGAFTLTTAGVLGASVASVSSSSGTAITVTINSGGGAGTLHLNLIDNNTILDSGGNLYLGGPGLGDGSFTTGETYTFDSAITVTTAADSVGLDGQCSLREAIINANNNLQIYTDCRGGSGIDHILFSGSLGTATSILTSDLPAISDTSGLTINGGGKITINGNDLYRVFLANTNVPLTLDSLTVAHGLGNNGGGAYVASGGLLTILNSTFSYNHATVSGGGVLNHAGTLVITNSTFNANSATTDGGGVYDYNGAATITGSTFSANFVPNNGGGINQSGGTLSVTGSTFSNNSASGIGGAIYNIGALTLANSTFLTNSAGIGGAIANSNVGSVIGSATILNSTFSKNSTIFSDMGAVYNQAVLSLSNTIIANSVGGGDCAGPVTANSTNNLIQDSAHACGLTNGSNGNIIGVNPNLGSAVGSPAYLPLNAGSAAINAGDDVKCAAAPVSNTSQNGLTRPNGAHCDIGAYEADLTPLRTYLPLIQR